MIYTTLNKIRAHAPCADGWEKLLASLGKTKADDEPLPLPNIIDSNGIDDALWCLRTLPEFDKQWRLFAVWCARKVDHLMKDQRSLDALDVVENYANGEATDKQLAAAWTAAWAAGDAARVAGDAAAAWATWDAAGYAAWAAEDAARAAGDAAWAAAYATWAAWDAAATRAAGDAARVAGDAARVAGAAQATELRRICEEYDNLEAFKL